MEEPIKGDASFKDCGFVSVIGVIFLNFHCSVIHICFYSSRRLYVLQSGVLHSWRLTELWSRLLEYIKPHLANRYQNLRDRLGS